MGNMAFFERLIQTRMADMHCGYIGRVLSTDGKTAAVQPLGMALGNAVVPSVPVACRYKISLKKIEYTDGDGNVREQDIAVPVEIGRGDLVACLCADRDITEAVNGNDELPVGGTHCLTDSIIVGIL